jgi:hypothetical protein
MTNADKMFKELEYSYSDEKLLTEYMKIQYCTHFKVKKNIRFYKLDKEIVLKSQNITENMELQFNLSKQELKAINEKCKELGWLN